MPSPRRRPILVVDDDIDHAVIFRTVLSMVAPDAEVDTCTDPRRLPGALLEAAPQSFVFMDRWLGGVDSTAFVRRVAADRPDLEVVVLSASLSAEERASMVAAGATDAFEKPGSIAGWRALLGGVLNRSAEEGSSGRDEPPAARNAG